MISDIEQQTRNDLAATYRLVNRFGWDDLIFTHISAKIPNTETFLINQYGLKFEEVTSSNLVKVDLHGNIIGSGIINPAGFVIHSAIHEARPDVQFIIHTHSKEGVAVSADRRGLLPISQRAIIIASRLSYHDYSGIVVDNAERATLKQSLGKNNYLILRNHGLLTTGNKVSSAFMNMYRLQKSCEIQVLTDLDNAIVLDQLTSTANLRVTEFIKDIDTDQLAWDALVRSLDTSYKN
jgi:ribulose-5-phosphate 4-epimerase/fuculose-1-phosphate aldolase